MDYSLESPKGLLVYIHVSDSQGYSQYAIGKYDSMAHVTQKISKIETTSMSSTTSLKVKALLVDFGEIFIV